MLTNLLNRFAGPVRPSFSSQGETGLRYEVCPPSLDSVTVAGGRGTGWLDSLSSWWRGSQAARQSAENGADYSLESTQLPDSDTRLCPRVTVTKPRSTPATRLASRLSVARSELSDSLADLHPDVKRDLQWRIRQATSLRELWHLRPEAFNLISIALDQREATRRLSALNRHFPARYGRSALSGFDDMQPRA